MSDPIKYTVARLSLMVKGSYRVNDNCQTWLGLVYKFFPGPPGPTSIDDCKYWSVWESYENQCKQNGLSIPDGPGWQSCNGEQFQLFVKVISENLDDVGDPIKVLEDYKERSKLVDRRYMPNLIQKHYAEVYPDLASIEASMGTVKN